MSNRHLGPNSPTSRFAQPGRNSTGNFEIRPAGSSVRAADPRSSADRVGSASRAPARSPREQLTRRNPDDYEVAPRHYVPSRRPLRVAPPSPTQAYRPIVTSAIEHPRYNSRTRPDDGHYYLQPANSWDHRRHGSVDSGGHLSPHYYERPSRGSGPGSNRSSYQNIPEIRTPIDEHDKNYGYEYTDFPEQSRRDAAAGRRTRRESDVGGERPRSMIGIEDVAHRQPVRSRPAGPPPSTRTFDRIERGGSLRREYRPSRDDEREPELRRPSHQPPVSVHQAKDTHLSPDDRSFDKRRQSSSAYDYASDSGTGRRRPSHSEDRTRRGDYYPSDSEEKRHRHRHKSSRDRPSDDQEPGSSRKDSIKDDSRKSEGHRVRRKHDHDRSKDRRRHDEESEDDYEQARSSGRHKDPHYYDEKHDGHRRSGRSSRDDRRDKREDEAEVLALGGTAASLSKRRSRTDEDEHDKHRRRTRKGESRDLRRDGDNHDESDSPEDNETYPRRDSHRRKDGEERDGSSEDSNSRQKQVEIVSPPRRPEVKPKGILKPMKDKFPEDPVSVREGVAPLKEAGKSGIPPNKRWTKIDRRLVNPEALEKGGERFEERPDYVIVLRVLSHEQIQQYTLLTAELREQRRLEDRGRIPSFQERYGHDDYYDERDRPLAIDNRPFNETEGGEGRRGSNSALALPPPADAQPSSSHSSPSLPYRTPNGQSAPAAADLQSVSYNRIPPPSSPDRNYYPPPPPPMGTQQPAYASPQQQPSNGAYGSPLQQASSAGYADGGERERVSPPGRNGSASKSPSYPSVPPPSALQPDATQ